MLLPLDELEGQRTVNASLHPRKIPPEWNAWLKRGWHGVRAAAWMAIWLPRVVAELKQLDELAARNPTFFRVIRREKRNVLQKFIRAQHLLPWFSKKRMPFFREHAIEVRKSVPKTAFDHAIPVLQLKSLVEMAVMQANEEQAVLRLKFGWLCPPVLIRDETHTRITRGENRTCPDFDKPLSRYRGMQLIKFDDEKVDPDKYTRCDLAADLTAIKELGDLSWLSDVDLPTADEEIKWTRQHVRGTLVT